MPRPLIKNPYKKHFFPMSQIMDLVWQIQKRSIDYDFVREMKDEGRFVYLQHRGRYYVHIDSLAEWIGVSPTTIRDQFRDNEEGVR